MTAPEIQSRPSSADPLNFTIKAATLKFDSREDLLPYLKPLIENDDVEEIHLGGNTYGVEACQLLGEILGTKTKLKVPLLNSPQPPPTPPASPRSYARVTRLFQV